MDGESETGGASLKTVDLFVAGIIGALAVLVMYDNYQTGAKWAADGPEAGYFPFYIGVIMFVATGVTFIKALRDKGRRRIFVDSQQFRSVLTILVPSMVFVGAAYFIGIYIATTLFLTYFMRVLGGYRAAIIAPVALGVPISFFLLFEIWFLVPLPKGPVESFFGF